MMMTLFLGMALGAVSIWLYGQVKALGTINWLGRVLYLSGIVSLAFGIETFTGSMIEHEMQAGWMGLGAFGFTTAILFIIGWRFGVSEKTE
ncbi:MAG: hypothetical protein HOK67_31865 [Deltaproteobacteria bacterium]|jgi:hypothetical protein|nr:hypothetical protein [Deltaproteobacteria bacterium]MBT4642756.1 hypothetical protein [Deltaproteobacteria bacterium]MBT6504494.1 hypothetical protein [Deltaproteobacteria bacterium]